MTIRVKVFIDLDGVIYNFYKSATKIFNIDEHDPETRNILKNDRDALETLFGKHRVQDVIGQQNTDYWKNLELFPWANSLVERCSELGSVCFLTSPGKWVNAPTGKMEAIKRDFPSIPFLIGKPKHFCADNRSILIDDYELNIRSFVEWGGNGVLWPNQYCIEDGDKRAETAIQDVISYVYEMKNDIQRSV